MKQYLNMIETILSNGTYVQDRTGVGTKKIFGFQETYDLQDSFPLVTTKYTSLKTIALELQWYLKGSGNIKFLVDNGVRIWNEWADSNGNLGKIYPVQWRNIVDSNGNTIDQFANVLSSLKENPFSRRHIISSWNVAELDSMKLPPCHAFVQFDVHEQDGIRYLSCQLYQRSADVFLGVPFNIACYALLTNLMAHCLGYKPYKFVHTIGDGHLYLNHIEQAQTLLTRDVKVLPTLRVSDSFSVDQLLTGDFTIGKDFELVGYDYHPALKGKVAV